jgi:predicted metal-dependent phosphoesterase TrpH
MVIEASRLGLGVIAITDHDTIEGALRAHSHAEFHPELGVEVVVGEEISTLNGHVIGLYLKEFIPPRLSAERTVEIIHQQEGLAVLAHPFHAYTGRFKGFPKAAELLPDIPFDAVETVNRDNALSFLSQSAAEDLAKRYRLASLGVSDAHQISLLGMGYTEFDGMGALALRNAILGRTTRAHTGRSWSAGDILKHLRDSARVLWRYSRLRAAA